MSFPWESMKGKAFLVAPLGLKFRFSVIFKHPIFVLIFTCLSV